MAFRRVKSLLVAAFSLLLLTFSNVSFANEAPENQVESAGNGHEKHQKAAGDFEPGEVVLDHILDNHEFHFADVDGHPVSLSLPIIVYSSEKGFSCFMSSKFEHGHKSYEGYKLEEGKIVAVDTNDHVLHDVAVYDFSITRNVAQMLLAVLVLIIVMLNVAKKYKKQGAKVAPSGFQNAVEPVITFIRDEVGKANLGHKYEKYMPYLLTVFFFILICNIFGLIPGSANITGNIAFTAVLGVISFIVVSISGNKHYWGHIFWPPVPGAVKPILIIVEFLSIFTKPFALIVRLFANMVAGHMIITCLLLMIFIFAKIAPAAGMGFAPVSVAFTIFIYCIEILVAFIQAFIFTNLTAVFLGQAIEDHHEHHHEEAHA